MIDFKSIHRFLRGMLQFGVVLLISACGDHQQSEQTSASKQAPPKEVRVGYLRLLSAAPLYTAYREGYFKEEGISINLRVIKSGPEGNEALAAGNIDVAFSILPSLVVARVQQVPSDLISVYGASIDGPKVRDHRILVAKDSPIAHASELVGKRLAVVGWPGRTSDVLELLDYLARNGLKQDQVTLVGMPHGEMLAALESRTVDAAASAEPYISWGIAEGKAKTLTDNEGFYYNPDVDVEVTTYLARSSWIDADLDRARRFVRALERGRVRSNDHEWLVRQGLPHFNLQATPPIDFVKMSPDQARLLRFTPIHPTATVGGLQHVTEQLLRFGPIQSAPKDLSTLIWTFDKGR